MKDSLVLGVMILVSASLYFLIVKTAPKEWFNPCYSRTMKMPDGTISNYCPENAHVDNYLRVSNGGV